MSLCLVWTLIKSPTDDIITEETYLSLTLNVVDDGNKLERIRWLKVRRLEHRCQLKNKRLNSMLMMKRELNYEYFDLNQIEQIIINRQTIELLKNVGNQTRRRLSL